MDGSFEQMAQRVRRSEVGRGTMLETPFGPRLLLYSDQTATGRFLHFVEDWLAQVRPFYANTHTSISTTGHLMTDLREQARDVVRRSVNAGPDDVALFTGSGATGAINKLVGLLGIRLPEPLDREFDLSRHIPSGRRPAVLIGPYEHHSNVLPWLESVADVVEIGLDPSGRIDVADLERNLDQVRERPLKIGAFSAASNVTGVMTDVRALARALHRAGAFLCVDFAASGPYVPIDMHPADDPESRIDALFLSMHKFAGGPGGSGILVADRRLFRTRVPERPGGGTVDYVGGLGRGLVDYTKHLEEREEGGTPAIMSDLRAAGAFLVKESLGPERIVAHELRLSREAIERLSKHPNIAVYGPRGVDRLAILPFNMKGLHHDFVATLLDHLFGIQNRSGCSCAGPYGHRLLGIDPGHSETYRRLIASGWLGLKPGWVRVSVPYYASEEEVAYLLEAIEFVADHGAAFLPLYRLSWRSGIWRHIDHPARNPQAIDFTVEALLETAKGPSARSWTDDDLRRERAGYLVEARRLASELEERGRREAPPDGRATAPSEIAPQVWFQVVHAVDA